MYRAVVPGYGGGRYRSLDIYDAVLLLKSAQGKPDPHWIDELTDKSLKISITAVIPNVATVPLTLILEKS